MNTLNTKIEMLESKIDAIKSKIEIKQNEINNFEYEISDNDFDEMLDCDGEVYTSVGSFYPSDILKSCDPIAYRCAKSDYESNFDLDDVEEYSDLKDELESLECELEELNDELDELNDQLSNDE